jgi:predicted esterase
VLLLLAAALPAWTATPARGAEKLDKKRIQAVAKEFFAARPWTHFESWDHEKRQRLLAEAKALGAIPEGSLEEVVKLLWKPARKAIPKFRKKEMDTPYGKKATWMQEGKGGKRNGLLIALHGGGEGAGNASEASGNWSMSGALEMAPQGIHLVHDTWNTVHGERFVLSLIELAKVRDEIDPDRVYVAGFSMGGTGSWHMVGRHPDLFAGAIPAHGVIMAEPKSQLPREEIERLQYGLLPNVRNTAVYFYTGYEDENCMPGTFLIAWDQLQEIKESDPDGYQDVRFAAYEGLAHAFPPGEPSKGLKWVAARKRVTFPAKLVWEYIAQPQPLPAADEKMPRYQKEWFYWLRCTAPADAMQVTAVHKGNEFDFELVGRNFPDDFTIYMNPEMIDVKNDVVVRVDGKEVYRGKPVPDVVTVLESLDAKMDRRMVFDRKVRIPEPD